MATEQATHTMGGHLARIAEQGYTVLPHAVDPAQCDEIHEDLLRLERELGIVPADNLFEGILTTRYNLLVHGSVANYTDNTLSVISTATNTVVGSPIPVGGVPDGVAVTPDGGHVYVANFGSNTVSVISTATDTVVGSPIAVGHSPTELAVTPNGQAGYVVNFGDSGSGGTGTVTVLDLSLPQAAPLAGSVPASQPSTAPPQG